MDFGEQIGEVLIESFNRAQDEGLKRMTEADLQDALERTAPSDFTPSIADVGFRDDLGDHLKNAFGLALEGQIARQEAAPTVEAPTVAPFAPTR